MVIAVVVRIVKKSEAAVVAVVVTLPPEIDKMAREAQREAVWVTATQLLMHRWNPRGTRSPGRVATGGGCAGAAANTKGNKKNETHGKTVLMPK